MKAAHRLLKVEKEKYKLKDLQGDSTGKLGSRQAIEQQGLGLINLNLAKNQEEPKA